MKAVYVIGILNFKLDNEHDDYYHRHVQLMDTRTKQVFYDKLTFVYLEMPKFHKTENELETLFDKWLFVLKNLSRLMERPAALQERVFRKVFEAAEIAKFTVTQYEEYEESLKVYRDWKNTIDTAEQKGRVIGLEEGMKKGKEEGLKEGLEKGLAQGREEGRLAERISLARKLRDSGLTADFILNATGINIEEID